jgi:nonribosomal peptide synthetase DhbF
VPSAVVVLDAFPTTINGKLDRTALPAPVVLTTADSGPVTLLEQQLCEAYARVLGLPRSLSVGVDDGFFDLGGHSLLAVRLLAEIRALTGSDPGIGVLFEATTPADLARALAEGRSSSSLDVLLPLRGGTGPALFCVHPAGGLSWCYAGLPRHLGDAPVVGVQARGIGSAESLPASLGEMADDYIEQILAHQPQGPYHLAGWSLGGMVVQAMAARLRLAGHDVGVVALLDAYPSEGLRRVAAPDEAEALGALLAMGGYDESILAGVPLDVPGVVAALRAEGSAMASLTSETLIAIKGTYTNTATILREFEHELYDGDVLFFRATVGVVDGDQAPGDWSPFVGGQITICDVECTHREMAQPEPLAEIGRHLRAALEADRTSRVAGATSAGTGPR